MNNIIVDIWGGDDSQEFLSRKLREIDDALEIARRELMAGFLVNLRMSAPSEVFQPDFDDRAMS